MDEMEDGLTKRKGVTVIGIVRVVESVVETTMGKGRKKRTKKWIS
jgi:hypothetical protein